MTIRFTPYRGKIEPITKIHKAEVKLFPEFIDVVFNYEYERFNHGPDSTFAAHFVPRHHVALVRSATYHEDDGDRELCQYVGLDVAGVADTIMLRCKSNREADELYQTLKEYLLMI